MLAIGWSSPSSAKRSARLPHDPRRDRDGGSNGLEGGKPDLNVQLDLAVQALAGNALAISKVVGFNYFLEFWRILPDNWIRRRWRSPLLKDWLDAVGRGG
jgi:hypothetical protein